MHKLRTGWQTGLHTARFASRHPNRGQGGVPQNRPAGFLTIRRSLGGGRGRFARILGEEGAEPEHRSARTPVTRNRSDLWGVAGGRGVGRVGVTVAAIHSHIVGRSISRGHRCMSCAKHWPWDRRGVLSALALDCQGTLRPLVSFPPSISALSSLQAHLMTTDRPADMMVPSASCDEERHDQLRDPCTIWPLRNPRRLVR
jgi:hypothetical protein